MEFRAGVGGTLKADRLINSGRGERGFTEMRRSDSLTRDNQMKAAPWILKVRQKRINYL